MVHQARGDLGVSRERQLERKIEQGKATPEEILELFWIRVS